MKYLCALLLFSACSPKPTSIEDVAVEVVSKDRGVVIDIEPGQKK